VRRWTIAVVCVAAMVGSGAGQPSGQGAPTATRPADPALWAELTEIDARAGKIKTLSADFEQQKFTALLAKPLVSAGRVAISGPRMRWDTRRPEPSVMAIDAHEAKLFYPAQKTLEVYPIDERLGQLAASPLPRLEVLRTRFSFERIPVAELKPGADGKAFVALKLTPIEAEIRQHVEAVRVLLDVSAGYIVRAEMTDADGDRTVLSFSNVQLNADVGDLALNVPPGTRVTRPLEGLRGSPKPQGPSK